jgi:hypothetical protein
VGTSQDERVGLGRLGDALAELPVPGDLTFSAAGNLYATHGLHAFAARCPPALR